MEQLTLNWDTYNDHLKEMMLNLMQSHESTDVTIVCEDKTKFKAHQFVLNACSPVLHSIIKDLPLKHPVIYLKGVLAPEMKTILQFMYLGQATFYQDKINDFLNVARTLELKEISKFDECDVADSSQEYKEYRDMKADIGKSHEENTSNGEGEELENISTKLEGLKKDNGRYSCNQCDKVFSQNRSRVRHIRSIHGQGLKFSCNDCSYITNRKDRLAIHVQTIHKGLGYACDECDYQTTQPQFLSSHKKNYHK